MTYFLWLIKTVDRDESIGQDTEVYAFKLLEVMLLQFKDYPQIPVRSALLVWLLSVDT